MEETSNQPQKQGSNANIMALISYIGFLCLIPILTKEKDEFVRFHAKQGLVLLIVELAGWIVLGLIPLLFALYYILEIVCLVLSIIGIMNVLNKQKKEIPVIGQFASKINI